MKICIPALSQDRKNSQVNEHFGSAPFFVIYDTETSDIQFIENTNANHSHGMCQPIAALADMNIWTVVCGGMGVRALQKLNQQGIKAFKATPGTVENACNQHGCH